MTSNHSLRDYAYRNGCELSPNIDLNSASSDILQFCIDKGYFQRHQEDAPPSSNPNHTGIRTSNAKRKATDSDANTPLSKKGKFRKHGGKPASKFLTLPNELKSKIFHSLDKPGRDKFRLTCCSFARFGILEILREKRTKNDQARIDMHFGFRRQDLRVLNALLQNDDVIAQGKVISLSLGCAFFDEEHCEKMEHIVKTFPCGEIFFRRDKKRPLVWCFAAETDHEEELVNLMRTSLKLLQNLEKGVRVSFGCTFNPAKWDTLPNWLRNMLRKHKCEDFAEKNLKNAIYEDQTRFLDWPLYVLFKAIMSYDDPAISKDADSTDQVVVYKDENGVPKIWEEKTIPQEQKDPITIDFLLKGKEQLEKPTPDLDMEWRDSVSMRSRSEEREDKLQRLMIDRQAKSRHLYAKLQDTNVSCDQIANKTSRFINRVIWLELPDVGFRRDQLRPGLHSLWYSKILNLLYEAAEKRISDLQMSDGDAMFESRRHDSPCPAANWSRIYQFPVAKLHRLELSDFEFFSPLTMSNLWKRTSGLTRLIMRRGVLEEGTWDEILKDMVYDRSRVPHYLEMQDLYQKEYDESLLLDGESDYSSGVVLDERRMVLEVATTFAKSHRFYSLGHGTNSDGPAAAQIAFGEYVESDHVESD